MSEWDPSTWAHNLDETGRLQFFTEPQRNALGAVTLVSAPLSAVGSALICYTIFKQRTKNNASNQDASFQRLMLGLSLTDLIASISMFGLAPWAIPRQDRDYNVSYAMGTVATCQASGFLLNFWFGTTIYTAFLCLYYMAVICYAKKDDWTSRWIEPWSHGMAWGYPLVFGAYAAAQDLFNPVDSLPGFCTVATYPFGCVYLQDIDCTRGSESAFIIPYYTIMGILGLALITICVSMTMIVFAVRRIEQRQSRYSVEKSTFNGPNEYFDKLSFMWAPMPLPPCRLLWHNPLIRQSLQNEST